MDFFYELDLSFSFLCSVIYCIHYGFCVYVYRIHERLLMPSESCPWPRQKDTWRMFWLTSRLFHSDVSVEVLDELLRPKIGIQMDKDAGLLNLQNLF